MYTGSQTIPLSEVEFDNGSYADPNGRVFKWKGDLYRGLRRQSAAQCEVLFRKGIVQNLIANNLIVETEQTDLVLEGYDAVVKHRTVPFVSYVWEWSPEMIRDAGIVTIQLAIKLSEHNLTLQDAHTWNILFDGYRPVFIDFGSVVPAQPGQWPAYDEFCRFFIHPLELMSAGKSRLARALLVKDYFKGVLASDMPRCQPRHLLGRDTRFAIKSLVRSWLPGPVRGIARKTLGAIRPPVTGRSGLRLLRDAERRLGDIHIPRRKTEWSDYYQDSFPSFLPSEQWTAKHTSLHRVLSDWSPPSVLDIGTNRGWYSQLSAELGITTVACDLDEACIDRLYQDVKNRSLSVLPLVMDLCNPSPGMGVCNEEIAAAYDRLRCDTVLALALTHHLVFRAHLNFGQIAKALACFARRRLVVEFVTSEDVFVREWFTAAHSWYTLANFEAALRKYFSSIHFLPSNLDTRTLLVCER